MSFHCINVKRVVEVRVDANAKPDAIVLLKLTVKLPS